MADHAKFLATAKRLIAKHGRTVQFQRVGVAPDPTKPWFGSSAPQTIWTGKAVFIPASGSDTGMEFIDADLLKRVSEVCLVASDTDLMSVNTLQDNGVFKTDWVQVLKPADLVLMYVFGVSR